MVMNSLHGNEGIQDILCYINLIRGTVLSTSNKSLYTLKFSLQFYSSVFLLYLRKNIKSTKNCFSLTEHKLCFMQINTD